MNEKRQCGSCGFRAMERSIKPVSRNFKGKTLTFPSVKGWHCPHCGEVEFADSAEALKFFAVAQAAQEKSIKL